MPLSVSKPDSDTVRIASAGRGPASTRLDPDGRVAARGSATRGNPGARSGAAVGPLENDVRHDESGNTTRATLSGKHPATLVYTYERQPDGGYRIVDTAVTLRTIDDADTRKPLTDTEEILATIAAAHSASMAQPSGTIDAAERRPGMVASPARDLVPTTQPPAASRALRAYLTAAEYFQPTTGRIHVTA